MIGLMIFQHCNDLVLDSSKRSKTYPLCPRRTLWNYATKHCYGQSKRWMCNLGLRDLAEASEVDCLFFNKFDLSVDSRPVTCLHEYLTKL